MNTTVLNIWSEGLYPLLKEWWEVHGFPIQNPQHLPPDGFMSFVDNEPVFAGFLFKDPCANWGYLAPITCNPEVHGEKRDIGFKALLDTTHAVAKSRGIVSVLITTNNKSLIDRCKKNNVIEADLDVTHLYLEVV